MFCHFRTCGGKVGPTLSCACFARLPPNHNTTHRYTNVHHSAFEQIMIAFRLHPQGRGIADDEDENMPPQGSAAAILAPAPPNSCRTLAVVPSSRTTEADPTRSFFDKFSPVVRDGPVQTPPLVSPAPASAIAPLVAEHDPCGMASTTARFPHASISTEEVHAWLVEQAPPFLWNDLEARVGYGQSTAMHKAARDGNMPLCKWLYGNGAAKSIATKDRYGSTALHVACQVSSRTQIQHSSRQIGWVRWFRWFGFGHTAYTLQWSSHYPAC